MIMQRIFDFVRSQTGVVALCATAAILILA